MDNCTPLILADDKKQFEKEQDELLKTVLNLRFFNPWRLRTSFSDMRSLQNDTNLEIYITNACNQNCSYCYLPKYPDLYPKECNDSKTILKNLKILYDFIVEQNFYIPTISFFTGEIWHTQLGWDILETTLTYIMEKQMQIGGISFPTNGYFAIKDETLQKLQQYINRFKNIGITLFPSISIDGKYVDCNSRKRNNGIEYTDDFYDTLFAFAKINNTGFHPIISALDIDQWPQNFDWWCEQCKKYNMDPIESIMFLECRNDDWTDDAIEKYCNFVISIADYYLTHECNNNVKVFADAVLGITHGQPGLDSYHPWVLTEANDFFGCTISQFLTVRLGDLAICPCHRQAYEKYLYGKFVIENEKITDIKAINPYMAIKILMANTKSAYHGCASCIFKNVCLKGCLGSQLETVKDPFFPIPSVCKMFKTKYTRLVEYYTELGLFDYYAKYPIDTAEARIIAFLLQLKLDVEEYNNGTNVLSICQ